MNNITTPRVPRPGAQIVPGNKIGEAFVRNAHSGWGYGYLDTEGNVTSTPTPMTWDEARTVSTLPAPDPATRATDAADLPSSPVCPLHGASCEAWR